MTLSIYEQESILKDLIKDLDNLTNLVSVKGIEYLTDAKLRAYMLQMAFAIEEDEERDKME